jgi:ribosome-binding protein aMBF1 (putative translation factor)
MSTFVLPSLNQRIINKEIESNNYNYDLISKHLMPIEFGNKIKEYRIKNNLTQLDLALKLNLQVNIINDYENGIGIKNKIIIAKFNEIFNL